VSWQNSSTITSPKTNPQSKNLHQYVIQNIGQIKVDGSLFKYCFQGDVQAETRILKNYAM
jgi:hypothetical protein